MDDKTWEEKAAILEKPMSASEWFGFVTQAVPAVLGLFKDIAVVAGADRKTIRGVAAIEHACKHAERLTQKAVGKSNQTARPQATVVAPANEKQCGGCGLQRGSKISPTGLRCMKHGLNVEASRAACKQWTI